MALRPRLWPGVPSSRYRYREDASNVRVGTATVKRDQRRPGCKPTTRWDLTRSQERDSDMRDRSTLAARPHQDQSGRRVAGLAAAVR